MTHAVSHRDGEHIFAVKTSFSSEAALVNCENSVVSVFRATLFKVAAISHESCNMLDETALLQSYSRPNRKLAGAGKAIIFGPLVHRSLHE